jgi:hypothetical protein
MSKEIGEAVEDAKKKQAAIRIGEYMVWNFDERKFGITHIITGESGVFEKDEFLPYVSSFFGLNF